MSAIGQVGAVVNWAGFNSRTAIVSSVAAGDSVFVVNCMCNFGSGVNTIGCTTVNDGSAYTNDAIVTNGVTGGPLTVEIWRLHNATAGTHNIVLTSNHANSNNFGRIIAFSVSGLQNAPPDITPKTNTGNSTTPQTGTSGTLSQSGEFVIAAMVLATTVSSPAFTSPATTGYISLMNQQSTANMPASADYQHVTATTALSAAWGTIAGSENWAALLAPYKDVVAGGTPTITSVTSSGNPNGTIQQGQTLVTITGTNFGSNTGSAAVTLIDGANSALSSTCTATSWGTTSVQVTANSGNVRNGAATVQLITSGGLTVTFGVMLIPPTGTSFGTFNTLKTLTTDPNGRPSRLNDIPDIGNGEQWEMTASAGTGTITVLQDGNMTWPVAVTQAAFRHHNGIQWSAISHWDLRGNFPVFSGILQTQNGVNGTALSWNLSTLFTQPDPVSLPLTYSIVGNALPTGLGPINSTTGVVTGTPTVTGTTTGLVVQAINTEGSYVQSNTFAAVIAATTNVVFSGPIPDQPNLTTGQLVNIDISGFFLNATSYSETGTLPAGLTFVGSLLSGLLTGVGITPGQTQGYPITVTGSNANPSSQTSNSFTLSVNNPVIVIPSLPVITGAIDSVEIVMEETLGRLNQFPTTEGYGRCPMGANDPTGQVYRFCRVPSGARIMEILVMNDANPSVSSYDCGVYISPTGGPVLSGAGSLFFSSVSLDSARASWTNLFTPTVLGGVPSVTNVGLRLWELLGMAVDPSLSTLTDVLYDVVMVARVPGTRGGNVSMRVRYLPPPPRGLATAMESPW